MKTIWTLLVLSTLALAGCGSSPTQILDQAPPAVHGDKIVISPPTDGQITVRGLPGAVGTTGATTVLVDVWGRITDGRRVLHLSPDEFALDSVEVKVGADGGFEPVTLGVPAARVFSEDEVNITPFQGNTQVGFTVFLNVPAAPTP